MSLILTVLLVGPLALLSGSLADGVEIAISYIKPLLESGLPSRVPDWVSDLPLIGSTIGDYWHKLVVSREELNELLRQFIAPTRKMALSAVQVFGQGLLQLGLVIFFAFFIFRDAGSYAEALRTGSRKLAGNLGERMLKLAEGTVTGAMVGIVGTAAAQSLVAMVEFIIVDVPGIVVLTVATFFFSMVPVIGATLIWVGAVAWLQDSGPNRELYFHALVGHVQHQQRG